ncbi:hypothetical protein C8Q74DRAFT_1193223 [Fomes fomentarius]|nr:hypothetical protein C8Q74DRAFT_1193223 [Fomes fomentarius]
MTPYASSTSPSASSAGSAPPATPQTPWTTISSNPSPLTSQHNLSPISPSSQFTNQTVTFDQIVVKSDQSYPNEQSVLDLAEHAGHPHGGFLVPQKTYRPHTMSDRRRYVEDVHLEPPIMFYTHSPFGCGISLKDALSSKFSSLEGRDDSMFAGRGPSVSIRLNWPGYAPWSRQIPTRDFRSPPHPITRAKLARNVAKTINRFITEMESQNQEDVNEARWRVGTRGIRLEDLALVGLQHVSMGSWQAHVRVLHRRR